MYLESWYSSASLRHHGWSSSLNSDTWSRLALLATGIEWQTNDLSNVSKSSSSFTLRSFSRGASEHTTETTEPDASIHCKTTNTGLVHRAACLFTPQLSLVFIGPTLWRDGQAELTWVAGYIPVRRSSPIQALTGPIHYLRWSGTTLGTCRHHHSVADQIISVFKFNLIRQLTQSAKNHAN